MPSARQPVRESAPGTAFQKALARQSLKVGVSGTAVEPPMKPHAQLIGGEETAVLSKEIQYFAFRHGARILLDPGFDPQTLCDC